jgi:hypothetical protein
MISHFYELLYFWRGPSVCHDRQPSRLDFAYKVTALVQELKQIVIFYAWHFRILTVTVSKSCCD